MAMSNRTNIRSAIVSSESAGVMSFMARTVGPWYHRVTPHGYRSGAGRHRKPSEREPLGVARGLRGHHSMMMFALMPAV
jgi:hypothetical protein